MSKYLDTQTEKRPERDGGREQTDGTGDQAVRVFVKDAATHESQRETPHGLRVGFRPVGHSEAGAIAGDASTGKNQQERRSDEQAGESVEPAGRHSSFLSST